MLVHFYSFNPYDFLRILFDVGVVPDGKTISPFRCRSSSVHFGRRIPSPKPTVGANEIARRLPCDSETDCRLQKEERFGRQVWRITVATLSAGVANQWSRPHCARERTHRSREHQKRWSTGTTHLKTKGDIQWKIFLSIILNIQNGDRMRI